MYGAYHPSVYKVSGATIKKVKIYPTSNIYALLN